MVAPDVVVGCHSVKTQDLNCIKHTHLEDEQHWLWNGPHPWEQHIGKSDLLDSMRSHVPLFNENELWLEFRPHFLLIIQSGASSLTSLCPFPCLWAGNYNAKSFYEDKYHIISLVTGSNEQNWLMNKMESEPQKHGTDWQLGEGRGGGSWLKEGEGVR